MGRNKIIGEIECPYVDKFGNLCGKLGRYNSTITVRNTRQKFAGKNQYIQFMHNDGSKKHNVSYIDYELMKFADDKFRGLKIFVKLMSEVNLELYRRTWKLHYELNKYEMNFTEKEKKVRVREFEIYSTCQVLMMKYLKYWEEGSRYAIEKKVVPKKLISNLDAIRDYFISLSDLISEGYTPIVKPVQRLYEKYVVPDIKKKQKISNKRQKNWPLESKRIRSGIMG